MREALNETVFFNANAIATATVNPTLTLFSRCVAVLAVSVSRHLCLSIITLTLFVCLSLWCAGDPGTAKSQMLKYAEKIAPRAVYSTGRHTHDIYRVRSLIHSFTLAP